MTAKHNPNPFIRMAQEAKEKKLEQARTELNKSGEVPKKLSTIHKQINNPVQKIVKKTGRGG